MAGEVNVEAWVRMCAALGGAKTIRQISVAAQDNQLRQEFSFTVEKRIFQNAKLFISQRDYYIEKA
jgi:hypothetical protein